MKIPCTGLLIFNEPGDVHPGIFRKAKSRFNQLLPGNIKALHIFLVKCF
jgi:hypothetical protein